VLRVIIWIHHKVQVNRNHSDKGHWSEIHEESIQNLSLSFLKIKNLCRMLFCKLKILTMFSQYILSSMRFLSSNLDIFTFNSSVHSTNTRFRLKLHKPSLRLKMYQQSSYCNCVNIYNKLPDDLAKLILNKKQFLQQLKKYLTDKPFYKLEEFFEYW
jgi:hypothetical protein